MRLKKWTLSLLALCAVSSLAHAAIPTLQQQQQILADLKQVKAKLAEYPTEDYVDPTYHQFFADKIPSLLQQEIDILQKLSPAAPADKAAVATSLILDYAILAMYDKPTLAHLKSLALSTKPEESRPATLSLALHGFWSAKSANAQTKVLDNFEPEALKFPTDNLYTNVFFTMHDVRPASTAITLRIDAFIMTKLHSPLAIEYRARPNKIDHPLRIYGTTADGRPFSTDRWKGKVILIDFWATWCTPCKEEMPNVVKLYDQYHAQGFEVVGVSCDADRNSLINFLKDHPEMPWPQLFGPSQSSGWHVIAELFGINSIPRMYLIDKNGILRSMTAWQDKEKLVPLLLAESPTTQPTPKP